MNNWLAWSLLSAVVASATAVLAKIGVTGIDSNFATAVRTTVIVVFTWIIQLGEASRVAPMDKPSVLFAILLVAIVLRETLTWHHWVGGGLVLAGCHSSL